MKNCPACKNKNWKTYLETNTGIIITGDQRITEGNLLKVICDVCGVVSNKIQFSDEMIEKLYGEEYELNTHGREEHIFYSNNKPIARSQVFANWIAPFITKESKTITEIGCGEGLLIEKLKKIFPEKCFIGYDGSKKAVNLAQKKNLNVKKKLITSCNDTISKSDIIIMINVIEHIQDINGTIKALKDSMNVNGRIIFCLPIQEYGGYDILFAEHVWHFTSMQFINVVQNNGLKIIYNDSNHYINHGIGLFVCEIDHIKENKISIVNENGTLINIRDYWISCFKELNKLINFKKDVKIGIFGSGEIFTLFYAFSNLNRLKVKVCIDETPGRSGTKKHNIDIEDINWLHKNELDVIIICTNKKYFSFIKEKLDNFKIKKYIEVYQ